MIPVVFLRFYLEQTHFAEMLKRRDCRQRVWKLLLGDSLNSWVHDVNSKFGIHSQAPADLVWVWLTPGYLACSGFDSMSVVGSFSFLLSQCSPSDRGSHPGCFSLQEILQLGWRPLLACHSAKSLWHSGRKMKWILVCFCYAEIKSLGIQVPRFTTPLHHFGHL